MKFRLFAVFLVGLATAFNTFAIHVGGRPLSAGLLAVALYFVSLLALPIRRNVSVCANNLGKFIMLPIVYVFLMSMMNIVYYNGSSAIFPFAVFMDWILFVALLAHSVDDSRALDFCLYGLSLGAIILSVLFFLGIGVEVNMTREGDRLSMFGSNENVLGIFQSISSCVILNLFIFEDRLNLKIFKWLFIIPLVLSASMIFATGSRTALLILILVYGCSILTLNTSKKFLKFILVVGGIVAVVYGAGRFLVSESAMAQRFLLTFQEGNTGGRTDIWLAYLKYFPNHPILGVGNSGMIDIATVNGVGTTDITGSITALSPHNVLVEVLMTTGVVGLLIMSIFWKNVGMAAYKTLKYYKYSMPIVLSIPIAIVILAGQILGEKYAWIIYAYTLACSMGNFHQTEQYR